MQKICLNINGLLVVKKNNDDIASLEMLISYDDCQLIKKIGNWDIELTPDNNFIQENNNPNWYG